MVEQTKQDIQARLTGHEFGRFKIVLKKPPHSQQISLQFLGDPESCEKARRLLGIYRLARVLVPKLRLGNESVEKGQTRKEDGGLPNAQC